MFVLYIIAILTTGEMRYLNTGKMYDSRVTCNAEGELFVSVLADFPKEQISDTFPLCLE